MFFEEVSALGLLQRAENETSSGWTLEALEPRNTAGEERGDEGGGWRVCFDDAMARAWAAVVLADSLVYNQSWTCKRNNSEGKNRFSKSAEQGVQAPRRLSRPAPLPAIAIAHHHRSFRYQLQQNSSGCVGCHLLSLRMFAMTHLLCALPARVNHFQRQPNSATSCVIR